MNIDIKSQMILVLNLYYVREDFNNEFLIICVFAPLLTHNLNNNNLWSAGHF